MSYYPMTLMCCLLCQVACGRTEVIEDSLWPCLPPSPLSFCLFFASRLLVEQEEGAKQNTPPSSLCYCFSAPLLPPPPLFHSPSCYSDDWFSLLLTIRLWIRILWDESDYYFSIRRIQTVFRIRIHWTRIRIRPKSQSGSRSRQIFLTD